jgi:hypothetical protein
MICSEWLQMVRYGVENGAGMRVPVWRNAASSAVFAQSCVSARDREHALSTG